jgi:cleavage and polyadenylation specificity factor subunit 2
MTAIIRFKPLLGVEEDEPLCYLLEIDDFTILLDCGWNTKFDPEFLQPLKKYVTSLQKCL